MLGILMQGKLLSCERNPNGSITVDGGIFTYKLIEDFNPPDGVPFEFETITRIIAIDPKKHFGRTQKWSQIAVPSVMWVKIK